MIGYPAVSRILKKQTAEIDPKLLQAMYKREHAEIVHRDLVDDPGSGAADPADLLLSLLQILLGKYRDRERNGDTFAGAEFQQRFKPRQQEILTAEGRSQIDPLDRSPFAVGNMIDKNFWIDAAEKMWAE